MQRNGGSGMREAPVSVISPEELDGNIKRARERLARLRGAYRCGLLSGQQLRHEAALVFDNEEAGEPSRDGPEEECKDNVHCFSTLWFPQI